VSHFGNPAGIFLFPAVTIVKGLIAFTADIASWPTELGLMQTVQEATVYKKYLL
jgi:hypothetical protein